MDETGDGRMFLEEGRGERTSSYASSLSEMEGTTYLRSLDIGKAASGE